MNAQIDSIVQEPDVAAPTNQSGATRIKRLVMNFHLCHLHL